jgi:capsular exopolysaccharide synthesis family protein
LLQVPALASVPNFTIAERHSMGQRLAGADEARLLTANGGRALSADLVVHHRPRSIVSEAFRIMRTGIFHAAVGASHQVLLVTSSKAGEGKTVTTLNLATVIGLTGARVLVIDADLRRPSCHAAFGVDNVKGLSTHLTDHIPLAGLVCPVEGIANVWLLSTGPAVWNPAELLGSAGMRAALAWAREHYDFVVLDSPPVLPVTDAVVLAREADGVLLVVKGQGTPREVIRHARDQLVTAGAHLLGVVVNDVDLRFGDYYLHSSYPYRESDSPVRTAAGVMT